MACLSIPSSLPQAYTPIVMDNISLDNSPESAEVGTEYPATTGSNTESSSYSDAPTPESESWSPGPAIDSGSALSISAEGTVRNVMPSAGGAEPHIDVSLALVVSDSEKRACDDIPGALNIEAVPSDRQTERLGRIHDDSSEDKITAGDRVQVGFPSSKFPTEIYETIIDHMAGGTSDFKSRGDLACCARVCRAWVPRAQMHLFSIIVSGFPAKPVGVQEAVRRKPFLLQYIKLFSADYDDKEPQPEVLLTSYHMPNLKRWHMSSLDLKTAHPRLSRFPSIASHQHFYTFLL
ncbi:hypothetical protein QCA50_012537 [Cerrena zonata]|uniref:F-box domain-containing protein n=1 Tax=Cerrena zonata TaxID=2478898 RepID=A0AAW0G2R7_9APHY